MRDPRERLLDVLEAIEQIEKHLPATRPEFDGNELVQVWMVRHLEIIGEALRAIPPTSRIHFPSLPWNAALSMRNIIVHQYFRIDLNVVWDVINNDLPPLKCETSRMLEALGPSPEDV